MCFRAALILQFVASSAWAQFGPIQPVENGIAEIQEVLTADLDLDGDQDIVVLADLGSSLLRIENLDGLGAFGPPQVIRSGMAGYSEVALTDLNGDLYPDLAISTGSDSLVFWKPNLGNGFFGADVPTTLAAIALPSGFGALICANITGDTLPEIIITSGDSLLWAINSTNGFVDRGGIPRDAGTFCPVLQAGDLDLDGDMDLIAVQSELTVFENNDGLGTTWLTTAFPSTIGWTSGKNMQLLDADGDGDLDLLGQDHQTRWVRNYHVEGQPWPSFVGEQFEPIHLSLNSGTAGHLGCGGTIDLVWRNLGSGVRWTSFDPIANAFAPPIALPDLPQGHRFHIADLNGDTRNDLIIAHNDSISWYANGLSLTDTISLVAPDILCANGGSIYLPLHTPIDGGIWTGPNVSNELFNTGGLDGGTYILTYTVIDTTGCPLSGAMDVVLIDAPTISTVDPLLDPQCPGDQIQFIASPGGEWYGAADVNGYLYTGCDARPLFGEVILLYTDQTEGQCSASLDLNILPCGGLAFGGPSVLCEDGPQQVITANRHLRQRNHGWPARLGGIYATRIGIRLLRSRARPRVLYDHRRRWWSRRMCRVRHARGGSASRHHRVVPRTVRYAVRDRRAIRAGPGKSAGWFMERARRGYRSEHLHSPGRRRLHSHLCCVQQVLRGVCIPTDLGDSRGGDRSTAQRSDLYQ
ncbi:MAG: VCBS repeat-containing protein [Flavobacteriales bacterium]|nr:VCBS repeat-containing protein [Flavobacteriales bacterium]